MMKKALTALTMLGLLTVGSVQLLAQPAYGSHPCCPATSSRGGWQFAYDTRPGGLVTCYYFLPDYTMYTETNGC